MADHPASPAARAEIDPSAAAQWVREGRARLVDVREPDEHAGERIEGASLHPLSRLDPGAVSADDQQVVVLHCKSGRRSAEARARLEAAGFKNVYSLRGGIEAWRGAGLPTVVNRRVPISIMRQVQIVAGGTVLVGSILAWFVSPWFVLLTGFFGAGLFFAGVSGTCAMATMLGFMPWNRAFRAVR